MMIVESGWGSMIPTVVIAHMDNKGPAAKSGQLNVGNQILAINGQSLVGLPLLECQNIVKVSENILLAGWYIVSTTKHGPSLQYELPPNVSYP
jgi:amyloid beta (A4) precursor protein-binding family A protein 1 (X11)